MLLFFTILAGISGITIIHYGCMAGLVLGRNPEKAETIITVSDNPTKPTVPVKILVNTIIFWMTQNQHCYQLLTDIVLFAFPRLSVHTVSHRLSNSVCSNVFLVTYYSNNITVCTN